MDEIIQVGLATSDKFNSHVIAAVLLPVSPEVQWKRGLHDDNFCMDSLNPVFIYTFQIVIRLHPSTLSLHTHPTLMAQKSCKSVFKAPDVSNKNNYTTTQGTQGCILLLPLQILFYVFKIQQEFLLLVSRHRCIFH